MTCWETLSAESNKKWNKRELIGHFYYNFRENTEENLLSLLEDTINKINSAVILWTYSLTENFT